MNIEGKKIKTKISQDEMYNFLSIPNNYKELMPENVEFFEATDSTFTFALSGLPKVYLKLKEKAPFSSIIWTSAKDSLIFDLSVQIVSEDNGSITQLLFNGNFNPFIKMVAEKPLNSLIENLTNNLQNKYK